MRPYIQRFLRPIIMASVLSIGSMVTWAENVLPIMNERVAVDFLGGLRHSAINEAVSADAPVQWPLLSIVLSYTPGSGALTPESISKLQPLYRVISSPEWKEYQFKVVCCETPPSTSGMIRTQWITQLQEWFDQSANSHPNNVQFTMHRTVSDSMIRGQHKQGMHVVRLNIYRVQPGG